MKEIIILPTDMIEDKGGWALIPPMFTEPIGLAKLSIDSSLSLFSFNNMKSFCYNNTGYNFILRYLCYVFICLIVTYVNQLVLS